MITISYNLLFSHRLQPWLLPRCPSRLPRRRCRHPGPNHRTCASRTQGCFSSVQTSRQQIASYRQTIARSWLERIQIRVSIIIGIIIWSGFCVNANAGLNREKQTRHTACPRLQKIYCLQTVDTFAHFSDSKPKTESSPKPPDTLRTPDQKTPSKWSKALTPTSVTTVLQSKSSTTPTRPVTTQSETSSRPPPQRSPSLWNWSPPNHRNQKTPKRSKHSPHVTPCTLKRPKHSYTISY